MAPSAILFSSGDLGRAFAGHILSQAGFHLTLVEQDEDIVDTLHQLKGYEVQVASAHATLTHFVPCDAILEEDPDLIERICSCDLITAFPPMGPSIAPLIAAGLRKRMQRGVEAPVNVVGCERHVRATTWLRQLVHDRLTPPELAWTKAHVGFADCAWDRIVVSVDWYGNLKPMLEPESPAEKVRVVTQDYFEWVVDDKQMKGDLAIPGMLRRSPLDPFITRSMFLLTAGHATAAYLGSLRGFTHIVEGMAVPEVEQAVRGVMGEVAEAMLRQQGFQMDDLDDYIDRSVTRFKNLHVGDTIARVARDPLRKLAKEERLIRPLLTSIRCGTPNDNLCVAIAAALLYDNPHDRESVRLHHLLKKLGPEGVLREVSGVSRHSATHAQLNEEGAIDKIVAAFHTLAPGLMASPLSPDSFHVTESSFPHREPIITSLSKLRKSAVHFGAGKIGRGFIGLLLALSGYEVTFAVRDRNTLALLQKLQSYDVHVVSDTTLVVHVRNVTAVLSTENAVIEKLATCDLVTTAVGVNTLPIIAPVLAKGIQLRRARKTEEPLNVIACENAVRATTALKAFVLEKLEGEDLEYAMHNVGFADSAVDRIVPAMERQRDPASGPEAMAQELEVTVEEFFEWDVDETQMKGERHLEGVRDILGVTLTDNLSAFVERKLFTLNTGHAITAYLGYLRGYATVNESIDDPAIEGIVRAAMQESAAVLVHRYGFDPVKHAEYIERIIMRFKNPWIRDDVSRVGRDPIRKLSPNDRLLKPLLGTVELGLPNEHLCVGVAVALRFDCPGDDEAAKLQRMIRESGGVPGALAKLLPGRNKRLPKDVVQRIMDAYNRKGFGPEEAAP
jgi:mannitol-1-phosphate 5-dehydrogenase